MMRSVTAVLGAGILAIASCSPHADSPARPDAEAAAPTARVRMDAQTQVRMGVRAAAASTASAPQAAQGYARVMDVGPLAAIESEAGAARAAAAASQAEFLRLASLAGQDQAASVRAVDAARAQAAADTARANLAARRIGLEWGPGLERMAYAERARLLNDIAAGRAALLRIDAPEASGAIERAVVLAGEGATPIDVSILGPAAATEARLQTAGVLAVARGAAAAALPAGRLLRASIETNAAQSGYLLPEAALVRADNSVWVYVKIGADVFERRDVSAGRAVTGGWFVADGFTTQDEIVVDGATSLLAAERGPVEAE
jgi:hypothetical protein